MTTFTGVMDWSSLRDDGLPMEAQSVSKTAIGMLHEYPNAPAPGARPVYWLVKQDGALDGVSWEHKGWLMPETNSRGANNGQKTRQSDSPDAGQQSEELHYSGAGQ